MSSLLSPHAVTGVMKDLQGRSRDDRYRDNPVLWAEEVLKVQLWSKQKEILMSLVTNKKTAVKSCHSIGKTFISAVAACWWVSTRPNSMVRSTAPTYRQVHELLWEEIRKFHGANELVGRITQSDEWKRELYGTEIQVGSGSKPADGDQHGFHGVHRPDGVLVILDEACGVPQNLFTASDAITTGRDDRVLAVGNPDDPVTEFGDIFLKPKYNEETGAPIWNLITVSAFDTPNFTGEYINPIAKKSLIDPEWVAERASEWGKDSGRYKAKILAEFPDQSDDAFFSQRAIDIAYETDLPDTRSYVVMGVDIAGYGDDDSVAYLNCDGHVRHLDSWSEGNAITTAKRIVRLALEEGVHEVRVDGSGIGSGIVDIMAEQTGFDQFVTIKVMGGNSPQNNAAHLNARAEQYDNLRKMMMNGLVDLDPKDEKISKQLLQIKYQITARGSIQIENKRDMRARNVKSPDELDAVVYATMDTSYITNLNVGDVIRNDPLAYLDDTPDWYNVLPW